MTKTKKFAPGDRVKLMKDALGIYPFVVGKIIKIVAVTNVQNGFNYTIEFTNMGKKIISSNWGLDTYGENTFEKVNYSWRDRLKT